MLENPPSSTMNPHPLTQPNPTQPEKTIYHHHFNYLISNVEDDISLYRDKYTQIVGISPETFRFKDKNLLYVKIHSDRKVIHNIDNISELKRYGMELKLSTQQLDQNSVFCLGIPAGITKVKKEKIISNINSNHPDLKVMDVFVLPLKTREQKITSIKISFATQIMVSHAMGQGIKIINHSIPITNIKRAKILGSPQCMRCYAFTHETYNCKNKLKCLHCSEEHFYKNCPNKGKSPTCTNCSGGHKPNSNRCPTRKQYLIIPKTNSDPDIKIIKNPESSFKEINGPNIKIDKPKLDIPTTSYNDCLNMALKFTNWEKAFIEFQKAFGLKIVGIPDTIKNDLKPEFKVNIPNEPKTNNQQNSEKTIASNQPNNNTLVFKPMPSSSGLVKPSPKTRHQKEKQKQENKKIQKVLNEMPLTKAKIKKAGSKILDLIEQSNLSDHL